MNLQKEIDESLARINAHIDSRFRGSRIATGKHCAKALRALRLDGDYCACGMPWEKEVGMSEFGCWSCGAKEPMP